MAWQQNNPAPPQPMGMGFVLKGGLVALGFTLLLTFLLAMLVQYTSLRETNLSLGGILIVVGSTMAGGWFASSRAGNRGLWNGLAVGVLFAAFTLLVTMIFFADSFTWLGLLKKTLWSALGGVLGGIAGVGAVR
ncbi:MAG TPA: TIGR04086 family membrane protein [Bacillota bacterium]|nr:TIGR04086 family membrane protein [Bacillota bacterium]